MKCASCDRRLTAAAPALCPACLAEREQHRRTKAAARWQQLTQRTAKETK